tara:strand:+ start:69 stop:485 length:417 start_codon:yes stop_codon:yes gene_type:complete
MAKSNMLLSTVCVVLGLHLVASLVFKIKTLASMDDDNNAAENFANLDKNNMPNANIADVVLIIVALVCLTKCCVGLPTQGGMKGVCVVTAVLMLMRSFPDLLQGAGKKDSSLRKSYPKRLIYGITGLVNALVAVACCC